MFELKNEKIEQWEIRHVFGERLPMWAVSIMLNTEAETNLELREELNCELNLKRL